MTVFTHHVYEYKKGLRNLVLHTMPGAELDCARRRLERNNIAYEVYTLASGNANVFFGATDCVEVVRAIGKRSLSDYTFEEDFILGTMLGYDRLLQCRRYLRFRQGAQAFTPPRGRMDDVADEEPATPAPLERERPGELTLERERPREPAELASALERECPRELSELAAPLERERPREPSAPEHTCSHDGDEPCTGCLTGTPCAVCRARMDGTNPLPVAVNE